MKKFKALYQAMYDDLKDAEMMIDYAYEVKEHEEGKELADELAKYDKFRLGHFDEFHKIFVDEAMKHKEVNEKTVDHCLWKQTHEHMQEWYDSIKKCIDKYK